MNFTPSDLPIENEYPKLVRDRIPEIVKAKAGKDIAQRTLKGKEYLEYLLKKLKEEAAELEHAEEKGNSLEELADILEILEELMQVKNLTLEQVKKVQKEKREKNGGFKKRILMLKAVNK
jgi:predicted house-cleaning noncanonical NTP pyrophosphatase (MazG superfamily)